MDDPNDFLRPSAFHGQPYLRCVNQCGHMMLGLFLNWMVMYAGAPFWIMAALLVAYAAFEAWQIIWRKGEVLDGFMDWLFFAGGWLFALFAMSWDHAMATMIAVTWAVFLAIYTFAARR